MNEHSGVTYCCGDRPIIRAQRFLREWIDQTLPRVHASLDLPCSFVRRVRWARGAAPWASRERAGWSVLRQPLVLATGAALTCESARQLTVRGDAATLGLLATSAVACSVGLAMVAAAAWWADDGRGPADPDPLENRALRLQASYIGVLAAMFLVGSLALWVSVAWIRGLERLSWLYFGFFSFAFVATYLWEGTRRGLAWVLRRGGALPGPWTRRLAAVGPAVLVALHAADQVTTLWSGNETYLGRAGLSESVADLDFFPMPNFARRVIEIDDELGARDPLKRPAWLRDRDVVLLGQHYLPFKYKHATMKQAAHYRELYSQRRSRSSTSDPISFGASTRTTISSMAG